MSPEIDRTRTAPPHDQSTVSAAFSTPTGEPAPPTQTGAGTARVPGYEITGTLGKGGMGVVYRAIHLTLGRPVALKMMLGEADDSSPAALRFLAEAAAVAAVTHPHVIGVYD
jgi:serine/threonine-protein kinase